MPAAAHDLRVIDDGPPLRPSTAYSGVWPFNLPSGWYIFPSG